MDFVTLTLLGISLILLFGFFAEFVFKRFNIPDVLFLILLGFILGPFAFDVVQISEMAQIAPVFTTFTLLFLLFDGAFNINLRSLIQEFSQSFLLTSYNFFISSVVIAAIMFAFRFPWPAALITGFSLGGVSSAFVIPVLQGMDIKGKIYSLLTLESALTDVFCIVFSLTVIEVINLGSLNPQGIVVQIVSLFAIALLLGVIAGIFWIFLILKVFKEHNYMMTIAFLILLYVLTEFLGGNGAIATMFFGLMLNNSKQLTSIMRGITDEKDIPKSRRGDVIAGDYGVNVTTRSEQFFYKQISFFLKTFFFVYIGLLIDLSDFRALIIGGILSFVLMGSRYASLVLTRNYEAWNRRLVNTVFARGLAAAAIAQIAIGAGVPEAEFIAKVIYITITGTIILSSISVFIVRVQKKKADLLVKPAPKPKRKRAQA